MTVKTDLNVDTWSRGLLKAPTALGTPIKVPFWAPLCVSDPFLGLESPHNIHSGRIKLFLGQGEWGANFSFKIVDEILSHPSDSPVTHPTLPPFALTLSLCSTMPEIRMEWRQLRRRRSCSPCPDTRTSVVVGPQPNTQTVDY